MSHKFLSLRLCSQTMYKVCIPTAGKGARMDSFTSALNKALLPVNGKPVISHIIEYYPSTSEIVIVLGYMGEQIKTYLSHAYPDRKFTFVTVDRYEGKGSGPGYSMLAARNELQCPFIFMSVDTLVRGDIPPPDENWFGVARVNNTERFCSVKVDKQGIILRIDDKTRTDNEHAFIGLAGIRDYEAFWNALESDNTLVAGELQVSNGFKALMRKGMRIKEFIWYDTGTVESYEHARTHYPDVTKRTFG